MKPGVELISEVHGDGPPVQRHEYYRLRLRIRLSRGDSVVWQHPWGNVATAELSDDGTTLVTDLRVDRENMFAGLFYGLHGMRVGGGRRLRIAPHLGYGESGVPGVIPANALLTVEVEVLAKTYDAAQEDGQDAD